VLGLEYSRLARNNACWHRLLEIRVDFCSRPGIQPRQPSNPREQVIAGGGRPVSGQEHWLRWATRVGMPPSEDSWAWMPRNMSFSVTAR